jgi:SHS family lactate transporter-like MFS transporter
MPAAANSHPFSDDSRNARNAVIAGFLGWTIDAFDFFILVFVLSAVAKDFNRSIPEIALTITGSLAMRPIGALIFGLLTDRYGRRRLLMAVVVFYSFMELASGLAPSYGLFLLFRMLYGIGMGGEWGVGASLTMESVPGRWRGLASGLLQQGYAVGYILAAICYFVVFPRWGWRPMFFITAVPAVITLYFCWKVEEPRAWHESRTDPGTYRRLIFKNWKRFGYLVILMAMMNFISHGTQDMYPTFLQRQLHYSVNTTAIITIISMIGAILGGFLFGHFSDRIGRRRAMIIAVLLAATSIPLWVMAPNQSLIIVGAFIMQFMVQGAWGVIPAHLNELSPGELRGFFPGFAYQVGVLIASSIGYIEALLGEHFTYASTMGIVAALVLFLGAFVIWAGPEAKGVSFLKSKTAGEQFAEPVRER